MDLEIPNIATAGSYNLKGNAYGFPVWKIGHFNGKLGPYTYSKLIDLKLISFYY